LKGADEIMAEQNGSQEINVGSLRFYPPHEPADQEIQTELNELWKSGHSFLILSGPPGVGKTRAAEDYLVEIIKALEAPHGVDACRLTNLFPNFRSNYYKSVEIEAILRTNEISFVWEIGVLHPQYTYEDLIRGYRLIDLGGDRPRLEVREGIFGFCARVTGILEGIIGDSRDTREIPAGVLILDEINRAPIGQLFGEAIYALDRRGIPVETPYELGNDGSSFAIPPSLLLLGTMNSVDRAVSGFDFALRRRFATVTMVPSETPIEVRLEPFGSAKESALSLFRQIRELVTTSVKTGIVPVSELIVGHSYFMPPSTIEDDAAALTWLAYSYQFQILPILLDYLEQGLIEYTEGALGSIPCSDVLIGERSLGDIQQDEILAFLGNLGPSPEAETNDADKS